MTLQVCFNNSFHLLHRISIFKNKIDSISIANDYDGDRFFYGSISLSVHTACSRAMSTSRVIFRSAKKNNTHDSNLDFIDINVPS